MTLQLINISKEINSKPILKDISLEVSEGECLALLGPSGCGKSTTLRIIAGLDLPTSGKIYINNRDVTNISPVKRKIGMVFQSYALFPHLTLYENLSIGLKTRGVPEKEKRDRISLILSIMKLDELSNRKPSELSGGQRQRVALARALLRDPSLYLLDEPMSNLDAQLREELRPELRKLILNGDKPVIYVTHDQHEAMAIANKIAVLDKGELIQVGTPKDLYMKPCSTFVANFIGRPQINIFNTKDNLLVGIRPEDIKISKEGINVKLINKEWLGNNQLVYIESEYGTLRMICDSDINISPSLIVSWDKAKEHIFDSNNKKRLN